MRTTTTSNETPSSLSSKRNNNFKWILRRGAAAGSSRRRWKEEEEEEAATSSHPPPKILETAKRRPSSAAAVAVARFRSVVMTALIASRHHRGSGGTRIATGTLYGHRHGHIRLAFQAGESSRSSCPVILLELATLTSNLVREMASGLVRIALECERRACVDVPARHAALTEEPMFRAYCNGRKCGYAVKRECGAGDWKVLRALEPVSMGAGVLPEGEVMYMRARFERVIGSKDSEAFYMMNPDGNGGTELSIYFLRV